MAAEPPVEAGEAVALERQKKVRADALRNRDKLLTVAAAAFAEHGVNASLEDIAWRAKVGIGTLYRHFPTREHLVEVVYKREVQALAAAADELAARLAPDEALAEWMQRFVDYIATKRGMANSLRLLMTTNSELFAETYGLVSRTLGRLVDTAIADGSVRSDVSTTDVMHALGGVHSAPEGPEWRERSRRLVALLMDGLRYGAPKSRALLKKR